MILRIVHGRLPAGTDAAALVVLRDRLRTAARGVAGLETLIVGTRPANPPEAGAVAGPMAAVLVTVWRDVESMARATAVDEQDRFLGTRLDLPLEVDEAIHYELAGRAFGAMPSPGTTHVRIVTVRSGPHEEARLIELLRGRHRRLIDSGLIATNLGRRVVGSTCEAITVGIWPDIATIAANGFPTDGPLFVEELADWADGIRLATYDGIEVAPRLPPPSGPSILVLDEERRIVDITPTGAATIGREPEDAVGVSMLDISHTPRDRFDERWNVLQEEGWVDGSPTWHVPTIGDVYVRFIAARDVPIPGRHTVLVHRWHEPAPTREELAAAIREAFPDHVPDAGEGTGPAPAR